MSRKKQAQIDLVRDYYKAKKVVESVETYRQSMYASKYITLYEQLHRRKLKNARFQKDTLKRELYSRVAVLRRVLDDVIHCILQQDA